MRQYRLLVQPAVWEYFRALERAAATQQPGGLRDRELQALRVGLRALVNGDEAQFGGKRLGFTTHDLSDCAEIKLAVIPESRGNHQLGPSHRLLYREFEPEDGGLPYREVVAFAPRRGGRAFHDAANHLGRAEGVRRQTLHAAAATSAMAPIRQPLPPDLRAALAAAGDVAPAHGAVGDQPSGQTRSRMPRRTGTPGRQL